MPGATGGSVNAWGQPVGAALPDWRPPPYPDGRPLDGQHCRLERLDPGRHGQALGKTLTDGTEPGDWTYMPFGPFDSAAAAVRWVEDWSAMDGFVYYAIFAAGEPAPAGIAAWLRIMPDAGSIEIGGILFSRALMRTAAATEALYLLIDHAFQLGYRRVEWKCDALNAPSRRAAVRLGFRYEGTFRQATVVKGRNRDTAWYAITDGEWPGLRDAYLRWLDPANFDDANRQRKRLGDCLAR